MKKIILIGISLTIMQSALAADNKETQKALPRDTMQDYFAMMCNVATVLEVLAELEEKEASNQPIDALDLLSFYSKVLSSTLNVRSTLAKFK